jgi:hypothetical protein
LGHFSRNFQEGCLGLEKRESKKYWEFLTELKQANRFLQGPYVKRIKELLKEKPITVGERATYRTLSHERTPLQNGIDEQFYLQLDKDGSATHILRNCEAIAYLKFCHLSHYFLEPGDHQDASVSKIVHFI